MPYALGQNCEIWQHIHISHRVLATFVTHALQSPSTELKSDEKLQLDLTKKYILH